MDEGDAGTEAEIQYFAGNWQSAGAKKEEKITKYELQLAKEVVGFVAWMSLGEQYAVLRFVVLYVGVTN
jgi:hypothetical protein